MKNIYFSILTLFSGLVMAQESAQISLGQGYANQVYYSLENGEVKSVALSEWDLAFDVSTRGSNIRFNSATGSKLYLYPKADKSSWSSIDTSGLSTWSQIIDSDTSWDQTAFETHVGSSLDVGWGIYNTITHAVDGDSIYIVELADNSFKKFWIEKLAFGTYTVILSDLDHSNLDTLEVAKDDYENRNFSYYSFSEQDDKDLEPATDSWDLVFTKYTTFLSPGVPFGVTGVLLNKNTRVEKIEQTPPSAANYSENWNHHINAIGYDWKSFNYNTFQFDLEDLLSYFVETQDGDIYQVEFTSFAGSSTGNVEFTKTLKLSLNTSEIGSSNFNLFPNPADNNATLQLTGLNANSQVHIHNALGQSVYVNQVINNQLSIDLSAFDKGIYWVQVTEGTQQMVKTLIVK